MTRELCRVQTCLNEVFKRGVLLAQESSLPMPRQGAEPQPHLLWSVSQLHLTRGLVTTPGSCADPASLEQTDRRAELLTSEQSQYRAWSIPVYAQAGVLVSTHG